MQHFQSPSTSHYLLVISLEHPQCIISISNFILKSHQAYQLLCKEPKMQTLQQFPFRKKKKKTFSFFSSKISKIIMSLHLASEGRRRGRQDESPRKPWHEKHCHSLFLRPAPEVPTTLRHCILTGHNSRVFFPPELVGCYGKYSSSGLSWRCVTSVSLSFPICQFCCEDWRQHN